MKSTVLTKDRFDMKGIAQAMDELRNLMEELNQLYPQRSFLLHQIPLTLLSSMNHLLYGIYGTGKSEILKDLLNSLGVDSTDIYRMDFSKQTTESEVVGATDVNALRNGGRLVRNPDGTIRQAKYAELGELFDAPNLLRLMLSILNERQYRRGAEVENIPLKSAFASTNISPEELMKRYPDADAIVDRFLFQCKIGEWLTEVDDFRIMFNKFRKGLAPSINLDTAGFDAARNLVATATDQLEDEIVEVMIVIALKVREVWNAHKWRKFSDRAFTQWLMIAEAAAIYNGHYTVTLDDLRWLKYVACDGTTEQIKAWDTYIEPLIDKAIADRQPMDIDDAIMMALNAAQAQFNALPSRPSDSELVDIRRELGYLIDQVRAMKAVRPESNATIRQFEDTVQKRINQLDELFTGGRKS